MLSRVVQNVSIRRAGVRGLSTTVRPPARGFASATADVQRRHEQSFDTEAHGMGSSIIHGYYDHLGAELPFPKFLSEPKTAHIVGAPLSWGQPKIGTDDGPAMLRNQGLVGTLINLEWRINDTGDLKFQPPSQNDPRIDPRAFKGKAKNCYAVGKSLEKIHNATYQGAKQGEFVLTLGGDHAIGCGTVAGILKHRPETGIIWVDAHADLNTPETSPSGNMHGMPVGMLLGLSDPAKLPGFEWLKDVPTLKPEQIVYVGLRDIDNGERAAIRELGIKTFTMADVDRYGIGNVMKYSVEHLRMENGEPRPLHLSFDVDAVDPEFVKATGTIVRGGLTFREAHFAAEACGETGNLASMDLVEVNPSLADPQEADETAQLGMALIASAMGARIL
mmetsp:Transcript_15197/g.26853  ORF Transcript_15197/g.26853 Transcript_15197/m.26853 type:complete len:390 (-) Transcript_15197:2542-3711(-)